MNMSFFLSRNGLLFGLFGWFRETTVAMRFDTKEQATDALRDLRLGAGVEIVERPFERAEDMTAGVQNAEYNPWGPV